MDPKRSESTRKAQTPAEVAAEFGTSRRTVCRAIHSGELVAIRLGKGFKILSEDRDRWLKTLRTK
jgi:excisionase family DNA binding protein